MAWLHVTLTMVLLSIVGFGSVAQEASADIPRPLPPAPCNVVLGPYYFGAHCTNYGLPVSCQFHPIYEIWVTCGT